MYNVNIANGNTQLFGNDLGKSGVMALTMAMRASKNRYCAGWINPHHGAFIKANPATKRANNRRWAMPQASI